jgi:acyl transferase domain-containing protein/acyl carrier protein
VAQVQHALQEAGISCQPVHVNRAFHSHMMAPAAAAITEKARAVTLRPPALPLASNLTGAWLTDAQATDPSYWGEHMLQAVRFCDNIQLIMAQQPDILLEVGPGRILSSLATDICAKVSQDPVPLIAATMRHPRETTITDTQFLCNTLARLWTAGVPLDWHALHGGQPRKRVSLPPSAFVRERCWPEITDGALSRRLLASGPAPAESLHPLLGRRLQSAVLKAGERLFEAQLHVTSPAYLTDHRIYGQAVVPGTAFVEMVLAAGATLAPEHSTIADMIVYQALPLADDGHATVQLVVAPSERGHSTFELWSLGHDALQEPSWTRHASGRLRRSETAPSVPSRDLHALQQALQREIAVTDFYQRCEQEQFNYGPNFRLLTQLWQGDGEALGRLVLPDDLQAALPTYHLHPALLDVCLQVMWGIFVDTSETGTYVQVGWDKITLYHAPRGNEFWSHAQVTAVQGPIRTADIDIYDGAGRLIASVVGAQEQRTSRLALLASAPWQEWLYTVEWRPQVRTPHEGDVEALPQHWLLLTTPDGMGQEVARLLQGHGAACTTVELGSAYAQHDDHTFTVRNGVEDLRQVLDAIPAVGHVVHLWSHNIEPHDLRATALEVATHVSCGGALHVLQALMASSVDRLPPALWLITRGAQVVTDECPDIAQAALWGMARVIDLEHPELVCIRVDSDPHAAPDVVAQQLCDELLALPSERTSYENQIAFRHGNRYVARLARTKMPYRGEIELRADATYLLTGGLGGLGLRLAEWMVERGARHLVLVGRSPAKPEALRVIDALGEQGADVRVVQADVTVADQVRRVIQGIDASTPLRGLMHAAGVLDDGVLMQQSWERFAPVLAPKLQGAWHLHEYTSDLPLDFFVVFSSDAALLGSGGQANHAAANACLDAFAHYRRASGYPALSISWGGWSEIGTAALPQIVERIKVQGMDLLSPADGLQVLETALQSEVAYLNVTPIAWERFRTYMPSRMPFWADLQRPEPGVTPTMSMPAAFDTAEERRQFLQTLVCEQVAQLLGLTPAEVGADLGREFFALGLDSLTSLELRNSLQTRLGCQLPATFIFQYPTLEALMDHLEDATVDDGDEGDV